MADILPDTDVSKVSILGEESIILGFHLTEYIARDVINNIPASNYVLVTDSNLAPLYLDTYVTHLEKIAKEKNPKIRIFTRILPPGELSKSRQTKDDIEDWLLSNAVTRDTCFLAMGGGVIGDLIGFVAATFMRGVPFVQIPTTLLAMVDSSIGGKTAIDTPAGKNLIGAFWQPKRIFMDLVFLKSLPEREFANGMAEVIKTAAIWSEPDFVKLENGVESIRKAVLNNDANTGTNTLQGAKIETRTEEQNLLLDVILGSARVKAHVVTNDEREGGLRGLLNFGHSIGHGIEALVSPLLLHGECVSIGCVKEAELSRNLGHLNPVSVGRLARCLSSYDLPISLDDKKVKERIGNLYCHVDDIMEVMKVDKKNQGDKKRIVLLAKIGQTLEPRASIVADIDIQKVLAPQQLVLPVTESPNGPKKEIVLTTPGSKSISNRALLIAALGKGTIRVKNLLHSDDTQYMLAALQLLNACEFEWEDNGETLVIHGGGGKLSVPNKEVYVGNAGTASRFLTTVLTMIPNANENHHSAVLTGNARMKQRPIAPLLDALKSNGAKIVSTEKEGFLPIAVTPNGGFKGGRIELSASISSQYVSSILLCAPYAVEPVELVLVGGQVISQPYIDMTIAMMESFGAHVERLPNNTYRIQPAVYQNPAEYVVESDASSATYPLALAAITGSTCTVTSIGSNSLQGDATFAINVLQPMGCKVLQTETSTTVTGPPIGQLKPLPTIDMEIMTDAFLTASVLAAVTSPCTPGEENITRITGIANQRVKECNRIAAMVHELTKLGVEASELPDGIQIHGKAIKDLKAPNEGIHCYDDHRIAMSFSVLSSVVPHGTIIQEKKCVEKTWPTWWDDLERKMGVRLNGVDQGKRLKDVKQLGHTTNTRKSHRQNIDHGKSIVIVGMRGVGKTTLGQHAAESLGFKFVDVDQYFEATLKTTVFDFINTWGWEQFRIKEAQALKEILGKDSSYGREYVVSCGGGIVETPESRQVLKEHIRSGGKVLHLVRDVDQVMQYLSRDKTRPMFGEDMLTVWRRRRNWYREVCNYEFVAYAKELTDDGWVAPSDWLAIKKDLTRFLNFITGRQTNQVNNAPRRVGIPTTFVSLTMKDIRKIEDRLLDICEGTDAVELRVDLLHQDDDRSELTYFEYVGEQLAILRRIVSIPVIFTVRSKGQAGTFPDDKEKDMFELLHWGLRWGCEYIDVETIWTPSTVENLVSSKGESLIIASWHDVLRKTTWDSKALQVKYELAERYGDLIKLVGTAESLQDNMALETFRASKVNHSKPLIAINMGLIGQLSRVINNFLTPITHPALPQKAAPGQLTLAEIYRARHLVGLLPANRFWLIGTPIQHSMSPTLHNTGFNVLGLPHNYGLLECHMVEYAEDALLHDEAFGGASVTIPHKVAIMKYLDEVTENARLIGAVNTVSVRYDVDSNGVKQRKLIGENTDFIGIMRRVQPLMMDASKPPEQGLVIGSGGTARAGIYSLYKMGIKKIYIWNRTISKAYELQKIFDHLCDVEVVEDLEGSTIEPGVIISTVPADSGVQLPDHIYGGIKGIICDMAYKPRRTKLLLQAERKGWLCVEGIDVLISQGIAQFEIWTGKHAPVQKIEQEVLKKYEL